jgi:hypothetical protein
VLLLRGASEDRAASVSVVDSTYTSVRIYQTARLHVEAVIVECRRAYCG